MAEHPHHLVVEVCLAARDDIDHDQANSLAQITGALDRECLSVTVAVLVGGADQLDRGDESSPSLVFKYQDFEGVGKRGWNYQCRGRGSPGARQHRRCPDRLAGRMVRNR